jgi:hypothetical protein
MVANERKSLPPMAMTGGKALARLPAIWLADQKNAWMPVCARPRISAWMSWVPS